MGGSAGDPFPTRLKKKLKAHLELSAGTGKKLAVLSAHCGISWL